MCFGEARKSPQCRYRNTLEEPTEGDLKLLSPALTLCVPSKRNRQEPGQWFASIRVTVTPFVLGMVVGVSIGSG